MRLSPSLILVLLLSLPAAPHDAATQAQEVAASLRSRLSQIESAFRDGDADALRLSFSTNGKVRVDLKNLTEGHGSYAAGQLQVIFGHIFEEFDTRELAFRKDEVKISDAGTAFARGRWVRRRPSGQESVDTLIITLRDEDGDWRIVEIRSSR